MSRVSSVPFYNNGLRTDKVKRWHSRCQSLNVHCSKLVGDERGFCAETSTVSPKGLKKTILRRVGGAHERLPRWEEVTPSNSSPWLLMCSSSINQRHINVRQINHVPMEAHLETCCMLGIGKRGDCFPLLGHHLERLYGTDGSEKVLQLKVGCG